MMNNDYNLELLITMMEKAFPWVDKIETDKKKVWMASSHRGFKPGDELTKDIIKLHFNYDNPKYLELRGKSISGKQVKQSFYDFLSRYLNMNSMAYGSPVELEFYEVGPKKF